MTLLEALQNENPPFSAVLALVGLCAVVMLVIIWIAIALTCHVEAIHETDFKISWKEYKYLRKKELTYQPAFSKNYIMVESPTLGKFYNARFSFPCEIIYYLIYKHDHRIGKSKKDKTAREAFYNAELKGE